jgi:hypothetical protein
MCGPPPLLPLSPIELEDGAGSVVGMTIVINELDLAPLTTKKLVFMTKRYGHIKYIKCHKKYFMTKTHCHKIRHI